MDIIVTETPLISPIFTLAQCYIGYTVANSGLLSFYTIMITASSPVVRPASGAGTNLKVGAPIRRRNIFLVVPLHFFWL